MAQTEFKDVDGVKVTNGVATKLSTANVSSPPSKAELISAFGPVADKSGVVGVLDDNGAGTAVSLVTCNGSEYYYVAMTKAL